MKAKIVLQLVAAAAVRFVWDYRAARRRREDTPDLRGQRVEQGPAPAIPCNGTANIPFPSRMNNLIAERIRRKKAAVALVLGVFIWLSGVAPARAFEKWLYYPVNLLVDENVAKLETMFARAGRAGYTHALVTDSKFGHLGEMDSRYFKNIERAKRAAAAAHIEIVPALFSIGYSNDLLYRDPNLVEGLPVKEARFIVRNGEAEVDSRVSMKGGDFQRAKDWGWKDETMIMENGVVRAADLNGKLARVSQSLRLEPFHEYHIEVEVKTEAFQGTPEVKLLAEKDSLNEAHLGVKPTQDWKLHHVVFNSLGHTQANLYFGVWDGRKGSLAFRNARISEAGMVNLIRRPGAPFVARTADGRVLVEGHDFEPIRDPEMGTRPWTGEYEVWHKPPALKTRLPDGTVLLLSYYHAITVYDGQAMICVSEPKTYELLRDQAQRMTKAWGARGYMMSFDEIRVMNWCDACQQRHLAPGQMLAETARQCERILREANPGGRIYTWSDMFDPNHNAHGNYYLVNGDLAGSWEGLSPQTTVIPWYFEKRDASLAWFAGRGHHQVIAGYYDDDPAKVRSWLEAASKVKGVDGVMYTTWASNYADMERFAAYIP